MSVGTWFSTDFDAAPVFAELPADISGGQEPALAIVDQVVRGSKIVGRVTGEFGAVAVRLRPSGGPVRVSVTVNVDDTSTRWWADRLKPPRRQAERPRLLMIHCQGRVRGAVVLARPQGFLRAGTAGATITFDLTADDLDDDGLLVVELADPLVRMPEWAAGRLSAASPIGVRIEGITVRPRGEPLPATPVDTGCRFLVLPGSLVLHGADAIGQRHRVALRAVPPAPPPPRSPGNRWTRQKPARAAFKLLRVARRAASYALSTVSSWRGGSVTARAVDLITGAEVALHAAGLRGAAVDLRLIDKPRGPVLVRLDRARAPRRERTARQIACRLLGTTE